jgi:radical SAM protein with 4Fe4S-binding SPASM domain
MVEPELKTVYWTATTECNQRCRYCWLNAGTGSENELDTNQWLDIFRRVIDMGLSQVKITGGEPLLHWQKVENVVDLLTDHGIWLRMETNGTLITGKHKEAILTFLEKENVAPVSISLDSHIPARHDMFRGMKGAFEKTLESINLLKERGISFSIVTVLHKENWKDLEAVIDFVDDLNPRSHQINIIMPEGRTEINVEYQLSTDMYQNLPSIIKKIKGKGKKTIFNIPYVFAPLNIDFISCTVGKEICGLLPNGDIAVCGAGIDNKELSLGNALKDDIEDIWVNSPAFLALRKNIFENKGICGNCIFAKYCLGHCRAYAYSVYGRLDAPYPTCQTLYEEGVFPRKYMINPNKDCTFKKES